MVDVNRAQIPFGNAVESSSFEESCTEASELIVLGIGIDKVAEASHSVVPQTGTSVFHHITIVGTGKHRLNSIMHALNSQRSMMPPATGLLMLVGIADDRHKPSVLHIGFKRKAQTL
jgi:hypothetical protein